ncbi:DUF3137 domain-containing protein [Alkalicoccobacillus plakortidis]|uniref:DUF3137 domain-containing protein n=1 Tax=Alkalicoccobacillus plakortidis TaxID=444060 RepID=A0ABT0XQ38_9BACI|nr:DUF3137 domain-containing protein [Alkalicoccobacillus plakortidis]MCM2678026.1 DUF3137 domain-containing protein [Alkalicoccobacillus plakortidis]
MRQYQDAYDLERFSKSEEEFESFYDQDLHHLAEELEAERKDLIRSHRRPYFILMLLTVAATAYIYFFAELKNLLAIPGVWIAYYLFVGHRREMQFKETEAELKERIKEELLTKIIYFMNEHFTYKPTHYIRAKHFVDAHIFADEFDYYSGDDFVEGYVGEGEERTKVYFSEVTADKLVTYEHRRRVTRWREAAFQGLFFMADFNKDFEGLTTIVPKEKRKSWISRFFTKRDEGILREMETMDIEFDKTFTVKTTDEIKARYILTPALKQRLMEFAKHQRSNKSNAKYRKKEATRQSLEQMDRHPVPKKYTKPLKRAKSYFSFLDGKMYFMLHTNQSHFESHIHQKVNKKMFVEYYKDINRAMQLVDDMNLNLRIWNK